MIDFFCLLYSSIGGSNRICRRMHIYSILWISVRLIANIILRFYLSVSSKESYKNRTINSCPIIVSLTSFPARINNLWIVIESLLRQTVRPTKVILWLSKEQFYSKSQLPLKLQKLEKYGLEIRFVDGDIKSHKKYYYVFSEYKNSLVFLVDDDIIYSSTIIERSLNEYLKNNGKHIIANYGNEITTDDMGVMKEYNDWTPIYEKKTSPLLFFGSGGGTLLKPSDLYKDCLNLDLSQELTPLADDVWLNAMARLNDCKITILDNKKLLLVINKKNTTLHSLNVSENQNDIQINRINNYYRKCLNCTIFPLCKK